MGKADGHLRRHPGRATLQDQGPVRQGHRFLHVVGDEKDGLGAELPRFPEVQEVLPQTLGGQGVQGGEGLVHEEDLGLHHQGPGEATRWRIPPESSLGRAPSKPSRPTKAMASRAFLSLSSLGSPRASRPKATFSNTVSHGKRAKLWKTMAIPSTGPSTRFPLKRTSPSSGG